MFELDMFYTNEEKTLVADRPNYFKFHEAVEEVIQDMNQLPTAAYRHWETKMWQWFDVYRVWEKSPKQEDMFPQPTVESVTEGIVNHLRDTFKAYRSSQVDSLKVTVDGLLFDGDEKSQQRMNVAINAAIDDVETVKWALADNTIADVTRPQLKQALRLAGKAMEAIWFQ